MIEALLDKIANWSDFSSIAEQLAPILQLMLSSSYPSTLTDFPNVDNMYIIAKQLAKIGSFKTQCAAIFKQQIDRLLQKQLHKSSALYLIECFKAGRVTEATFPRWHAQWEDVLDAHYSYSSLLVDAYCTARILKQESKFVLYYFGLSHAKHVGTTLTRLGFRAIEWNESMDDRVPDIQCVSAHPNSFFQMPTTLPDIDVPWSVIMRHSYDIPMRVREDKSIRRQRINTFKAYKRKVDESAVAQKQKRKVSQNDDDDNDDNKQYDRDSIEDVYDDDDGGAKNSQDGHLKHRRV
jgi:DNA-directed RNA polymerase subunit N (RpoN/RPB10)